jgi:dCTP deaminase
MTIQSDRQITALAKQGMITPFTEHQVRIQPLKHLHNAYGKVISYGLSSYGYDVRCANEFKIFTNVNSCVIDPKDFHDDCFVDFTGDVCIIPPNSFVLARTVERFVMPPDVTAICVGKSTYARCGIVCNVTPIEAGWEGFITLEFSNTTPLPAKMYAHEGCAQLLFFKGEPCDVTYADRGGKYQNQTGITLPR